MSAAALTTKPVAANQSRYALGLAGGAVLLAALMAVSVTVGTADLSIVNLITGQLSSAEAQVLTVSRIPRTLSLIHI